MPSQHGENHLRLLAARAQKERNALGAEKLGLLRHHVCSRLYAEGHLSPRKLLGEIDDPRVVLVHDDRSVSFHPPEELALLLLDTLQAPQPFKVDLVDV